MTLDWYPLRRRDGRGNILLCRYEQNSMPEGMEQGGQLLFLGGEPALGTTQGYNRIGFTKEPQALFQVPGKTHPNHDPKVLAVRFRQGLEALFRESGGSKRRRRLSVHFEYLCFFRLGHAIRVLNEYTIIRKESIKMTELS
jgi:hypothetical protein